MIREDDPIVAPSLTPSLAPLPSPDDSLLESLEIATGHVQRGQAVNDEALAEASADIPSMLIDPDVVTPCAFITGKAGVGKSTLLRERCANDPKYAILSASTGIAAINLSTITIHSLLGFFDTDSLRDAYIQGQAQKRLKKVVEEGYRNVVVDECSMISKDVLDVLVRVFDDVNGRQQDEGEHSVGLILCGDACQLPPIADRPAGYHPTPGRRRAALPVPWCFDSQFWSRFAKNTTHLTKVWRQADTRFLAALDFARAGRGRDCLQVLQSCGQRFENNVDMEFKGTTVVGKNDDVDRINQLRLDREKGRLIRLPSRRWAAGGRLRPEWKNIPERNLLRENCYVMILANQYSEGGMVYANGDCGWVRGIQPSSDKSSPPAVMVELVRTGEVVYVGSLVRDISFLDQPEWIGGQWGEQKADEDGKFLAQPHYRKSKKRWVTAQLEYFPLRLAYASTCHKVQGLSLDRVQIDFRTWNWKQAGMVYVGMSRARTLEGLRLVGPPEMFAERCKVDPKVVRWL
jgi:ATP-dependent DNA helicase PIF1